MGINVIHRFLEGEDVIRWARDCSGPALDDIWKESWLQDGIGSRLNALVGNLEMAAGAMRVLTGEEQMKKYPGKPVWSGFHFDQIKES